MEAQALLEAARGKLLVYAPNARIYRERLKKVSIAAEKTANMLNLDVEVVALKSVNAPIYVYYEDGENEPVPLYCDKEGKNSTEQVCTALKNIMFVLSFHPKYSALRKIRKEIIRFS